MVAFTEGEVFLKSATFDWLMHNVSESAATAEDRTAVNDALEVACLWVDDLADAQRERLVSLVLQVIGQALEDPDLIGLNEVARAQLTELCTELERRYRPG